MKNPREPQFNTIQEALDQIQAGKAVILVDDEDRENEGDLVMAAEKNHSGWDQLHGKTRAGVDLFGSDT